MEATWASTDGSVRLYLGDSLDVVQHLESVDAVVTDPPYGVDFVGKRTVHSRVATGGYISGDNELGPAVVAQCLAKVERGVVFPGLRLMFDYPRPYEVGGVFCPSGAGLCRWGFTVFHPILFYGKGLPHTRQSPAGFQSFATAEENGHPCPKPVEWMDWSVEKCTNSNQTVIDPFMGSGTTGVACVRKGRKFIGIEREPEYFEIAKTRIQEAMGMEVKRHGFTQRRIFSDVNGVVPE